MFCIRRASRRGHDVRLHRNCSSAATSIAKRGEPRSKKRGKKRFDERAARFASWRPAGFFSPRRRHRRRHVSPRLLASFSREFQRTNFPPCVSRAGKCKIARDGRREKEKREETTFQESCAWSRRCGAFVKLSFSFSSPGEASSLVSGYSVSESAASAQSRRLTLSCTPRATRPPIIAA